MAGLAVVYSLQAIGSDLGVRLFEARELKRAKAVFEARAASNPGDAESKFYLGQIAFMERDFAQATSWFEQAKVLNPTNSAYWHWLGRAYGLQADERRDFSALKLLPKIRNAFTQSAALDPNNFDARFDLIRLHCETPKWFGGSIELAQREVEAIRRRDAYLGAVAQGDICRYQKKTSEAERAYQAASALRPDRLEAHAQLGELYQETKQYDKAYATFEKVVRLKPDDGSAYFALGEAALLSGKHLDRAAEAFQAYLKCEPVFEMPSLAQAQYRLGQVYQKQGERELARRHYEQALQLEPGHKEAKAALEKIK